MTEYTDEDHRRIAELSADPVFGGSIENLYAAIESYGIPPKLYLDVADLQIVLMQALKLFRQTIGDTFLEPRAHLMFASAAGCVTGLHATPAPSIEIAEMRGEETAAAFRTGAITCWTGNARRLPSATHVAPKSVQ